MTVEDSLHTLARTGHPTSSGLIDDVTKDFKEFWDLPIKQGDAVYTKSAYDKVNASLIFERLAEETGKDDLALVCPDDPTTTLLIIIESLLSLLKYDMLNSSSQVLSTIKLGDPVGLMYKRKMLPGIYTGVNEINGRTMHGVKTEDGVTTWLPLDLSRWRIQPYMSAGLSARKRSAQVFGEILEELIGLPPGGLMAFQRSRALLVTPEKGRVIEAIRGVTLGGDPIEAVFPVADYGGPDNWQPVGGNALQREPVLGLVSNVDTAVDIALSDPSVKLVIIDGASKVRTGYGSISRLNSDTSPRKIICLLKTVDEEELTTLAALNIGAWVWKRPDFSAEDEAYHPVPPGNAPPFELHERIINNLAGAEPQAVRVEAYKQLDKAVKSAMSRIRLISRETPKSDDAGFIFRWAVSLINSMLQLPVPMHEYNAYVDSAGTDSGLRLDAKIAAFEEKLKNSYALVIPSALTEECDRLTQNLWNIYKLLSLRNPKAEELDKILDDNKDRRITVACCRPEYAEVVRKIHAFNKKVRVIPVSEAGSIPDENLIVTGWLNRRLAARLFLAPYKNITYLLYEREALSYHQVMRSHPSSPVSVADADLRTMFGLDTAAVPEADAPVADNGNDIEDLIKAVNDKFGTPAYADQLHPYGTADMVSAKRLVFEDDSYAYLSDTQNTDKLDRTNRSTHKNKLNDIAIGDELIFADSGRDMFEELLDIIRETDEYKALFEKARLWHRALESYIEENNLDEEKLVTHLALVGSRPNIQTVRMWVKGTVISPAKEYLQAIAKVTGNAELNSKLDEVTEACTKLYALHIQTGRLLVRRIIKAAVQEDEDMLNEEAREKIEAYSQNARVVTVREISDVTIDVPAKATGKLFEAGL